MKFYSVLKKTVQHNKIRKIRKTSETIQINHMRQHRHHTLLRPREGNRDHETKHPHKKDKDKYQHLELLST